MTCRAVLVLLDNRRSVLFLIKGVKVALYSKLSATLRKISSVVVLVAFLCGECHAQGMEKSDAKVNEETADEEKSDNDQAGADVAGRNRAALPETQKEDVLKVLKKTGAVKGGIVEKYKPQEKKAGIFNFSAAREKKEKDENNKITVPVSKEIQSEDDNPSINMTAKEPATSGLIAEEPQQTTQDKDDQEEVLVEEKPTETVADHTLVDSSDQRDEKILAEKEETATEEKAAVKYEDTSAAVNNVSVEETVPGQDAIRENTQIIGAYSDKVVSPNETATFSDKDKKAPIPEITQNKETVTVVDAGQKTTGTTVKRSFWANVRDILTGKIWAKPEDRKTVGRSGNEQKTAPVSWFSKVKNVFRKQDEAVDKKPSEVKADEKVKDDKVKSKTFVEKKIEKYDKDLKKRQAEAQKYVDEAKKHIEEGNYGIAQQYLFKAKEKCPEDTEIRDMIVENAKITMYELKMKNRIPLQKEMANNARNAGIDIYKEGKEKEGWFAAVMKGLEKPEVPQNTIVKMGRIYNVDECVQIAISRSPRFVFTDEQIKLAEMRIWEARRDLLPSFATKFETSSGRIGADSMVRHYRGNKYQFELKQTIFDGMEGFFNVKQAETNLDQVKLEKKKILLDVAEEVKKAYYSLDRAKKSYEMQQQIRAKIGKYYDIATKVFQDELISNEEFLKVKTQYVQSDFQCISTEEDMLLAEMILFQAMSFEPEERIDIMPVEHPKKILNIGLENCYDLALANQPDFLHKAKVLEYYNYERKMKKAKGWPKIEFNSSFGAAYENYEPLSIDADYTADDSGPARSGRQMEPEWYAGAKGSIPLWGNTVEYNYVKEQWAPTVSAFRGTQSATSYYTIRALDNLQYFSDLQEARVGYERANYEYEKGKHDLLMEIRETYFKYRKSVLQMDIAANEYEHQKMLVDIMEEKMKYGELAISNVIEEEVKLGEYEFAKVQADTDYYTSIAALNKSIGINDYFKPDFEDEEFVKWRGEMQARHRDEKTAEEKAVIEKENKKKERKQQKKVDKKASDDKKGSVPIAADSGSEKDKNITIENKTDGVESKEKNERKRLFGGQKKKGLLNNLFGF
ncbi:MAG TPA: TolC family protein [Candidatus Omnitrophota bacterium]|nr:TolC family protein [Candidatus Omnitrophota bacterium]